MVRVAVRAMLMLMSCYPSHTRTSAYCSRILGYDIIDPFDDARKLLAVIPIGLSESLLCPCSSLITSAPLVYLAASASSIRRSGVKM